MSMAAAASTATSALTSPFTPAATGAPKTRLHLTRRGRFVVTTLAAIPLVAGAAVFAINGGGAAASAGGDAGGHFSYQVVQSGDSLWSIAERVAPDSDPRDVVARIVSLNQLSTSMVTPGQRVAIPAEYAAKS
jgi:hypothetical protein